MSLSTNLVDLPGEAVVMRVLRRIAEHFPQNGNGPSRTAFRLTTTDYIDAARRGIPPLLSVFDQRRTTLAQARALRGCHDATAVFGLRVSDVIGIQVAGRPALRVVEDPLPSERGPGAEGHAGIAGLEVLPKQPKHLLKQVQQLLANCCFPLGD